MLPHSLGPGGEGGAQAHAARALSQELPAVAGEGKGGAGETGAYHMCVLYTWYIYINNSSNNNNNKIYMYI